MTSLENRNLEMDSCEKGTTEKGQLISRKETKIGKRAILNINNKRKDTSGNDKSGKGQFRKGTI